MYNQRSDPGSSYSDLVHSTQTMSTAQWGRLATGAALMLAGSGLVSLGTLFRLAAFAGGGALAYQALKTPSAPGERTAAQDTRPDPLASQHLPRGTFAKTGSDASTSLAGADALPAVDLRGV